MWTYIYIYILIYTEHIRRMSLATTYRKVWVQISTYFVKLSFEKLAIVDQSVSRCFGQTVRASVRMTIYSTFSCDIVAVFVYVHVCVVCASTCILMILIKVSNTGVKSMQISNFINMVN